MLLRRHDDRFCATDELTGDVGVGLALGLAAIGAGFSQVPSATAVGMLAEDAASSVSLDLHRSSESIVILGALPLFLG